MGGPIEYTSEVYCRKDIFFLGSGYIRGNIPMKHSAVGLD